MAWRRAMERAQLFLDQETEEDDILAAQAITNQWILSPSENSAGGSRPGRLPNIDRNRIAREVQLIEDYFADFPVFGENLFRHRYRMRRSLFLKIHDAVLQHDRYFLQKPDALGKLGLASLTKVSVALRMLAAAPAADSLDEYFRIAESTIIESTKQFCTTIVDIHKPTYLRAPTPTDLERILKHSVARGFPGMIGSIDCMHWTWKNCPVAYQGIYSGISRHPTVVLEVVASYDMWIWHAFFGMPGSNKDLNVLDHSHISRDDIEGCGNQGNYRINDKFHDRFYMLTDEIYPRWPVFVQSITDPQGEKQKHFATRQEAVRKDVKRCVGILQSQFAIVQNLARLWNKLDLKTIMETCIILHNMIVEDQRDETLPLLYEESSHVIRRGPRDVRVPFVSLCTLMMRDEQKYHEL